MKNSKSFVIIIVFVIVFTGCENFFNDSSDSAKNYTIYDISSGWLIEKGSNALWVNNKDGIATYDYDSDKWNTYTKENLDLKSNAAGPLLIDGDDMWIGYGWANDPEGWGVSKWDRSNETVTHYGSYMDTANMPSGPVWSIAKHPDTGDIWIGTRFDYAGSYFNGNEWTAFEIEDGAIWDPKNSPYFDCGSIFFEGDRGFFKSYRGGMHVYDFASEEWLHTEKGADNGTESFIRRGYHGNNLVIISETEFYLSTNDNLHDEISNEPDGIWHYKDQTWTNISPSDYESGTSVNSMVKDAEGNIWALFLQDYSVRYWDGTSWTKWDPEDIDFSESTYIEPMLFDNGYLWFAYHEEVINEEQVRIGRYPITQ